MTPDPWQAALTAIKRAEEDAALERAWRKAQRQAIALERRDIEALMR